ncbi:alpha/beta fold hydrolase [Kocuria sp. M1N1S27]|uniref:alpha/beta fold hydrolase n=1 Tax=Kocuria kalidii TaxID=3376283 RepID=UPI0037A7504F
MSDVISYDGTRLALTTWGPRDAPIVVLVHGLGLSTDSWGQVPDLLAADHRVVAYDLRGHGQSGDARNGDYSMETQAKDLEAVLNEVVPEGSAAVVVGNSLGGGVIVARAHHCGNDLVAGAVFAGSGGSGVTFPGFPARNLPAPAQAALRLGWMKALKAGALIGKRIRALEPLADHLVRRMAFAPKDPQEAVARVRENFLSSRPQALARTTLASVSHDGTRMAPDLNVPTLVIHGSADPEVSDDELKELMAALPDAELMSLPGEGHMLALTRPELLAGQVTRWVQHTRATGRGPAR